MKKFIKKCLPDILIIVGVSIFAVNYFKVCSISERLVKARGYCSRYDYITPEAIATILITIGVIIFIRRYLIKK
jgi:hypothetical protein